MSRELNQNETIFSFQSLSLLLFVFDRVVHIFSIPRHCCSTRHSIRRTRFSMCIYVCPVPIHALGLGAALLEWFVVKRISLWTKWLIEALKVFTRTRTHPLWTTFVVLSFLFTLLSVSFFVHILCIKIECIFDLEPSNESLFCFLKMHQWKSFDENCERVATSSLAQTAEFNLRASTFKSFAPNSQCIEKTISSSAWHWDVSMNDDDVLSDTTMALKLEKIDFLILLNFPFVGTAAAAATTNIISTTIWFGAAAARSMRNFVCSSCIDT